MLGRTQTRTHDRIYCQTMRTVRDISRDDRARIVTCRLRTLTDRQTDRLNLFPLIPACTARPGLPLSPPETAFLESPYYRPQTASIADRHHPTNFHSVTYTQNDDAAFEAGSDNDHKSFLRMRVIFTVEYPAELFRFRRVLDDILSSFDVF